MGVWDRSVILTRAATDGDMGLGADEDFHSNDSIGNRNSQTCRIARGTVILDSDHGEKGKGETETINGQGTFKNGRQPAA